MPEIKFQHIVSYSSEDKVHKAENLLCPDTFRKWKCFPPGEKQACVVIQLEKSSLIHSVHIGNEGSAFVEVLVGRSVDQTQDFKVLLVASSFMSPMESKNGSNLNRVRMFGPEKLSSPTSCEKWDLIKIVCTQPFNKSTQYGISFIKLNSPPCPVENNEHNPSTKKIGSFSIKDDDDDNDLHVGSLFEKRKENKTTPSTVATIRDASSLASLVLEQSAKLSKTLTPASTKPLAKQNDETNNNLNDKIEHKEKVKLHKDQISRSLIKDTTSEKTTYVQKRKEEDANLKSKNLPKKAKSSAKTKPFNKLLEKIMFTLSGFQNPYRSELRDKAIKMGARYKGDWDKSCTHLICAFVNTPKYMQVRKDGGRIVTKDWIIDCYEKKALLPWRDYKLENYQADSTTDESETDSNIEPPQKVSLMEKHNKATTKKDSTSDIANTSRKTENLSHVKGSCSEDMSVSHTDLSLLKSDEEYAASTDVDESNSFDSDSGKDTEEELRKAQCTIAATKQFQKSQQTRPDTTNLPLPELPEFFKNKCFFLYGKFSSEEIHNLQRCIIAFHGSVSVYMDEKVNFVVTKETWDDRFNDALEENDQLIFVKPQWIYECKEKSKQIPYQRFVVVPTS